MKGRFKASWRVVLALALVLSLGLVTAAPVAALNPTGISLDTCKAGVSATYTLLLEIGQPLVVGDIVYIHFPAGTGVTGVSGATIDGNAEGVAVTSYVWDEAPGRLLEITLNSGNNYSTATSRVIVVSNITNPCTTGSKTLQVWTSKELTEVDSSPYTICVDDAASIVITPNPATGQACVNTTFTVMTVDACNNTIAAVNATWVTNVTNIISYWPGNIVHTCNATVQNLTATSGAMQAWVVWTVTVGDVAGLGIVSDPGPGSYAAGSPILVTVNATDSCNNTIAGVPITASLVGAPGTGTLSGNTTPATDASGIASFNLSICLAGDGKILTFTAGSAAVNATAFNITPGAASKLVLLPATSTIKAGGNQTYAANVTDACDNVLVVNATGVTYSIPPESGGTNITNGVNATKVGTYTVTGTNGTYTGFATLNVDSAAANKSFAISPELKTMIYGDPAQTYTAEVDDFYGNPIDVTSNTTFSIDGVTFDNAVGVTPDVGTWTVDGTYGAFSNNATLTVTAAMCYVATAAYGTPMAEEIQILREFRDGYLLTNPLGRALVDLYYRTSPPIAQFISEQPALQLAVRAMLVPALAMSTIAVNTTLATPITILSLLLASIVLAAWATRRRERKGPSYA